MHYQLLHKVAAGAFALLLMLAPSAQAQTVTNGNFDTDNCSVTNTSAFVNGCVPGWRASHGSPQVKGVGDLYAYMWSQSGEGEGIFTTVSGLTPNTPYELTFSARGYQGVNLAVKVATNLGIGGTTGQAGGPIPGGVNTIWNQTVYPANGVWTQFTLQLSVPTSGSYQVWFYPETATSNSTKYEVHINDVSFDPANCLTRKLLYQNTSNLPAESRTMSTIRAGSSVNSAVATGPVRVLTNQIVAFRANQDIALLEGFGVDAGATFSASFVGQGCAASRPVGSDNWWTDTQTRPYADSTQSLANGNRTASGAYPNPTSSTLTLVSDGYEAQATLYNQYGIATKKWGLRGKTMRVQVDISDLPVGRYSLRIVRDNGSVSTEWIEIRR